VDTGSRPFKKYS